MRSLALSVTMLAGLVVTPAFAQNVYSQNPYPQNGYPQANNPQNISPQASYPQNSYQQGSVQNTYPQNNYPQYNVPPSNAPQTGNAPNATPVTAQGVPPGANPATGARPGNEIGTGMSLPLGTRASNIDPRDTRSPIAPNLPSPAVGENASAADYLRAAQAALANGRTGEAQQAMEMAQTRLLDRSVPQQQTNDPSSNPAVAQISQALKALAAHDRAQAMQLIQSAIPSATAMAQ